MKMRYLPILFGLYFSFANAQDKIKINAEAYDKWHFFDDHIVQSPTGEWIGYIVKPVLGDGVLTIENVVSRKKIEVARGHNQFISENEQFSVFKIAPQYDTLRTLELEKVDKKNWPIDSLGIYYHEEDSVVRIPKVKSFKLAEEGSWLAYLLDEDRTPECPKKKKCLFKRKKNQCEKHNTTGHTLIVMNPTTDENVEIHGVVGYKFDKKGEKLIYVHSHKGQKDTLNLYLLRMANLKEPQIIDSNRYKIQSFDFSEQGDQLVYLASSDTSERKNFELQYWSEGEIASHRIVDSLTDNMPYGWTVSAFKNPHFSENGKRVFFGTAEIVRQDPKDTLLDSEKAKVDVWSWNDPDIQPHQLLMKAAEEKRAFLAVYHIAEQNMIQLGDSMFKSINLQDRGNANLAIASVTEGYKVERTWNRNIKKDFYTVNIKTGEKELLRKETRDDGALSPNERFYVWYEKKDSSWKSKNIQTQNILNLTKKIETIFANYNNGLPDLAHTFYPFGWLDIDGKDFYVVRDEFDIWALNPAKAGGEICLTNGVGREKNIHFKLVRLENDSLKIQLDKALVKGNDEITKNDSYWQLSLKNGKVELKKLFESDHNFILTRKAKTSDRVLLRRMNVSTMGEIESTTMNFNNLEKLTDINPQQNEYNWVTNEFVEWKAFDGKDLRGILYKPEDFDATKSYPLMVYFYELSSQTIHKHYSPRVTASVIRPTEYASNGYIVFIPDIHYKPGHPAQSAYNCVVSGTDFLTRKFSWIDSTRMAIQGQSWGGYQTAQLITMTNKYKAAMAGAPVSNMFSAYGGIRWGSGVSRIFQYEREQSRIGHTIWERPDLYIENSPIFGLDKVKTPLLIMHNDGDGAVPWYQGIELSMGLRRLSKPSWMLNYNGDQHNLRQLANKKDLSIRMRQFFDHYLLGAPMPKWMKEGVPAVDKGKDYGLELIND